MTSEQVVHLRRMENTEVEAVVTAGPVDEAAREILRGIESHGHEWRLGSVHTGVDGEVTRMEFEVDVVLEATRFQPEPRTYTWFHVVLSQSEPYKRIPADPTMEASA